MENPFSFIRSKKHEYETGTIEIQSGLEFSQFETLKKADFYYNSRYYGASTDSLGRKKQFDNISKHRVLIAQRATDFDRKDVEVEGAGDGMSPYHVLLAQYALEDWLDNPQVGKLKNRVGKTWAKYGGVLIQKTEVDGELVLDVPAWADMVTDTADIKNGIKIRRRYLQPHELKAMEGKWDNIQEAIELAVAGQSDTGTESTDRDTPTMYTEVYEIHGILPETIYDFENPEADPYKYERRFMVVASPNSVTVSPEGSKTEHGLVLYNEKEDKDPFKYAAYDEQDKRGLGIGIMEDCFEAQMGRNDTIQKQRDALELGSKLLLQAPVGASVAEQNALTQAKNGQILKYNGAQGLTRLDLTSNAFAQFSVVLQQWDEQAQKVTSTYPGITGEAQPSGTPLGSVQIQNVESASLFDYRREELGLLWEEIYTDWVLPFVLNKLKKDKKLITRLPLERLRQIDEALVADKVMTKLAEDIDAGKQVNFGEVMNEYDRVLEALSKSGNNVKFTIDDEDVKNIKARVRVRMTNERRQKQSMLQSLDYVMKTYLANRDTLLSDPNLSSMLNKMLDLANLPPLQPIAPMPQGRAGGGELPQLPESAGLDRMARAQSVKAKARGAMEQITQFANV